ncbi:unnamed protein product [Discosporangium mesarthrocarpum]
MDGNALRRVVLAPTVSPPSGPELHDEAKNHPFALVLSLEAVRGQDYFPMERFRGRLQPLGHGGSSSGRNDGESQGGGTLHSSRTGPLETPLADFQTMLPSVLSQASPPRPSRMFGASGIQTKQGQGPGPWKKSGPGNGSHCQPREASSAPEPPLSTPTPPAPLESFGIFGGGNRDFFSVAGGSGKDQSSPSLNVVQGRGQDHTSEDGCTVVDPPGRPMGALSSFSGWAGGRVETGPGPGSGQGQGQGQGPEPGSPSRNWGAGFDGSVGNFPQGSKAIREGHQSQPCPPDHHRYPQPTSAVQPSFLRKSRKNDDSNGDNDDFGQAKGIPSFWGSIGSSSGPSRRHGGTRTTGTGAGAGAGAGPDRSSIQELQVQGTSGSQTPEGHRHGAAQQHALMEESWDHGRQQQAKTSQAGEDAPLTQEILANGLPGRVGPEVWRAAGEQMGRGGEGPASRKRARQLPGLGEGKGGKGRRAEKPPPPARAPLAPAPAPAPVPKAPFAHGTAGGASRPPAAVAAAGAAAGSSTAKPPAPLVPARALRAEDFEGCEDVCLNAGATKEGLGQFVQVCGMRKAVSVGFLWGDLTTNFSTATVKYCTPSQSCARWNCACGRLPRAAVACAPIIGAVVYLPPVGPATSSQGVDRLGAWISICDDEWAGEETFLLPLAPCESEEGPGSSDDAGGVPSQASSTTALPICCQTTSEERWEALGKVLSQGSRSVMFNAQVALMPFALWAGKGGGKGGPTQRPRTTAGSPRPPAPWVADLFDPKVVAWMLNTASPPKSLEFEELCHSRLPPGNGERGACLDGALQGGGGIGMVTSAVLQARDCCQRSLMLADGLIEDLARTGMLTACNKLEMPVVPALAAMEVTGIVFLPERVSRFSKALAGRLEQLKRDTCAALDGHEFNLASPEQVAGVLFERLQLPAPPTRSGSKHASTSEEVLEGLLGRHPAIAPILEFRGVNKLKTTYVDKLAARANGAERAESAVPSQVGATAARIHAAWHQTSVRTGRLSCSRPNLQQIPKSGDALAACGGINIRDAFVATRGFTLMAADYSQIEMRVLAHACGDQALLGLFSGEGVSKGGRGMGDIYLLLAAQVLSKSEGSVSKAERDKAKTVCLGIIYGMGIPQVARKLGVKEGQATDLVRSFLETFPGIDAFLRKTRRFAREHGFIKTLTGRRRHLPEIQSKNTALRAQAERQAVNSVVQGTAADIIKSAMAMIASGFNSWKAEGTGECPRLLMQIHDELVFECPANEEDLERLKGILQGCMEQEVPRQLGIKCPLVVNMMVGMSWGSMRPVVRREDDGKDAEKRE